MKLYHISLDTENLEKEFIPRIPECTGDGEDETIPRICFAPSIEECIQATHPSDYYIGQRFALFELEIADDDPYLVYPNELHKKWLVPDALENNEFWLCRPIYLIGEIYEVTAMKTKKDFAWSCIFKEDILHIVRSLNTDPYYHTLAINSYDSKESYERIMNFANSIQDDNIIDNLDEEIANINWAQKRTVESVEVKLIYSPFEELVC